jgi:hypothetical protein
MPGRTALRRRSSPSASRPARSIERSAARAWSGRLSKTSSAAPACTTIIETLCAITSCSSRAMRACSSPTARRAASRMAARRLRAASPSAQIPTPTRHREPGVAERVLDRGDEEVDGRQRLEGEQPEQRHARRASDRQRPHREEARDRQNRVRRE